jgi:hypothetical protein
MSIADVTTFTVGEHTYRTGRLSTFDQLELATTLRQVFFNLALLEKEAKDKKLPTSIHTFVQAMCGLFGLFTKEDRDAALRVALSAVARGRGKNNANWDPAYLGGEFMFNDLDMPELLEIVYRVFQHNGLIRFFSVSPDGSAPKGGTSS